jgi:hypothetical protein
MKWNAFVFLRLCNLKSFLYYRMVKALPFMLGKALGKPGKTPNIISGQIPAPYVWVRCQVSLVTCPTSGIVKPLQFMLGKVPGEPGDTPNLMGKSETIP